MAYLHGLQAEGACTSCQLTLDVHGNLRGAANDLHQRLHLCACVHAVRWVGPGCAANRLALTPPFTLPLVSWSLDSQGTEDGEVLLQAWHEHAYLPSA